MAVLTCRQYCGRVPGAVQGAGPQGGVRQEGEAAEHAEGARGGRGPRDQGFLHKVREDQEIVRILPFKGKRLNWQLISMTFQFTEHSIMSALQ